MDIKSLTKRLAITLAVAGGLALASQARAQDIYYMYNFYANPTWPNNSSLYGNWAASKTNTAAVNFIWDYTGDPTNSGVEVVSTIGGYGSGYADLNGGTGVTFDNGDLALATNDTLCILSFTVNPTPTMSGPMFYTNYNWIGIQFFPNCDSGPTAFLPALYGGWNNPGNSNGIAWSGSNVTVTINMAALTHSSTIAGFTTYGQAFKSWTQGGTNHLYGCNIGVAPAVIWNDPNGSSGLPPYDITFNSITFTAPPSTPPNPTIRMVGPNVVISWPDPNNIFTLYQSANMALFSWAPWGFPPVYNNGTNTVTIPPPFNQALYFRLANTTLQ